MAVLLGLCAAALFAVAAPAAAGPYPPTACAALSVSTTVPYPGQRVDVAGTGFKAGTTVTLVLGPEQVTVGKAAVGKNGTFATTVTIPTGTSAGTHLLYAKGGDPSCPVDPVVLQVQGGGGHAPGVPGAPQGGSHHGLAFTGIDVLGLILIALALIATGLVLNERARHRHIHAHTPRHRPS